MRGDEVGKGRNRTRRRRDHSPWRVLLVAEITYNVKVSVARSPLELPGSFHSFWVFICLCGWKLAAPRAENSRQNGLAFVALSTGAHAFRQTARRALGREAGGSPVLGGSCHLESFWVSCGAHAVRAKLLPLVLGPGRCIHSPAGARLSPCGHCQSGSQMAENSNHPESSRENQKGGKKPPLHTRALRTGPEPRSPVGPLGRDGEARVTEGRRQRCLGRVTSVRFDRPVSPLPSDSPNLAWGQRDRGTEGILAAL